MAVVITEEARRRMQPAFADLEPYDPLFTPVDVLLSANENPCDVPPVVRACLNAALTATPLNRYPDPMSNKLRDAIALWRGCDRENVIVGNGGDELLYNLLLAFGGPGRVLVNTPPAFSEYALQAQLTGTTVRDVWRTADFALDEEAVIEASKDAAIVILTSPNNPTGDLASREFVERLARSTDALVLVDEAYGEFAGDDASCLPLVKERPNVVVLRTLSKAYALAGARCGYIIASPDVVAGLAAVRQPYSVNVLTQAAAQVVVEMHDAYEESIARIVFERERLYAELRELADAGKLEVWESAANFLFVRVTGAARLFERLRDEHSILVRNFSGAPGCADCLRFTVGSPEENDRLFAAVRDML